MLRLRLGILPLFASQRLFPRLGELRARHPELHLDIDTAAHGVARLGDGLDAVIALAREIDPALYAQRLDRNSVYVIGARALIEGDDPIRRPKQLAGLTALLHRDMPDTFTAWRRAAGVPDLEPLAVDHFDSGQLMLEAAAQGLGVAFMLDSHFADANDDRLVKLFDIDVESPYSYWFACRPRALIQRPVRLFHDWLIETLGDPSLSPSLSEGFAAYAARALRILPGLRGGSPLGSASTCSMPSVTSPQTVYWPSRNRASSKQMKNWLFALFGIVGARHRRDAANMRLAWLNSAGRFGLSEPCMPVPVGSPPCAMNPGITRWNTTPS